MEIVAEKIIKELKQEGFTIQRYNSVTSKSIYIKMDYGVTHSIRISNHPGKKHLKYRFNVLEDIKEPYQKNDGQFERYYYGLDNIQQLIEDILVHRKNRIEEFGKSTYKYYMSKNRYTGRKKRGFWQSAEEV